MELKLPPADAYHKIRLTIDEVNDILSTYAEGIEDYQVLPTKVFVVYVLLSFLLNVSQGNVCFASSLYGFCFTLPSFATIYAQHYGVEDMDPQQFASRLFGDLWYQPEKRTFARKPPHSQAPRSFVQFVLEPMYKLMAQVVGDVDSTLEATIKDLGIELSAQEKKLNIRPLLKLVCTRFYGFSTGVKH